MTSKARGGTDLEALAEAPTSPEEADAGLTAEVAAAASDPALELAAEITDDPWSQPIPVVLAAGPAAVDENPRPAASEPPPVKKRRIPQKPVPAATGRPLVDGRPRLLLLDGHSLAYRAFFALPVENFSTTTGQPTNAVYGFTAMLINILRDESPTHVAVAFDRSEPTFRHVAYTDYKAGRSETPADFRGQVSLVKEVLDALRVPQLDKAGFEADDLIATLATKAAAEGMEVLIVTGDRDALQLVTDDVTVLMTGRGVSDMRRYTPGEVFTKYGLTPVQYPDFAALRGDPSDNLPNIPGVGEKTASKWIVEYGSLTELVDRVDTVKGKAGDALRANLASVMRNRTLTELDRDVDLPVGPHDLVLGAWDREEVHQLFDTLQFRVLRERLYATLSTMEPEVEEGFSVEVERLGTGTVGAWLAAHASDPLTRVGVHVRGTWGRGTGTVERIALATPGPGASFAAEEMDADDDHAFAAWLGDANLPKAMHDSKGPSHALAAHGWTLAGLTSDTALAAYLALPGQRSFDLADLCVRYLRRDLKAEAQPEGQLSLDDLDGHAAELEIATSDVLHARAVLDLADELDADLVRRGATELLRDIELPLVDVLARMERIGIAVDTDHLLEAQARLGAVVADVAAEAYASVGKEFNLGSPKQLQEIFFEELKLPKTKKIKTGYTTDADALLWLAEQDAHPLPEILLRHRDASKLKTVVDGLIPLVDDNGRIHTTYSQMIAATGRLSSTDPNLQNVPVRSAEGRQIRAAFVVGAGFESLMTADYSQIEMRLMAHLAGDEGLIEAFGSGEDLHTTVASAVFELPAEQIDAELRRRIKAMSYGLAYGLSPFGLAAQLKITPEEAKVLTETYFERFGGVRDYLRDVVAQARKDGYTETVMGRRRYLPDLSSDNFQRRQMAERMALNAPIQGSAADVVKVAMLNVDRALAGEQLASRVLLQVHDELVLEVAPGEREQVEALVRREMAAAFLMRVELQVSVGVGRSWDDAAH